VFVIWLVTIGISVAHKNILTDANTRISEQQRFTAVGNKRAGGKMEASPDQMGVQPDEARLQLEEQLQK
jgi:hypothetical protein